MEKYEETKAQLEEWSNVLTAFEKEVVNISLEDQYMPHNLNSEDLSSLTEQLSRHSKIIEAYLVGKFIESIPSRNVYLLSLKVHVPENCDLATYSDQLTEKYTEDFQLPPDSVIYILLNSYEDFEIKVKAIESSQIFGQKKQQIQIM